MGVNLRLKTVNYAILTVLLVAALMTTNAPPVTRETL